MSEERKHSFFQKYFFNEKKNYPSYYAQITRRAKALGSFSSARTAIIAVPVHTSEPSLRNFFDAYRTQTADSKTFEIFLFLNRHSADPSFENLEREILIAQKTTKLNISYFKKTFKKKTTIGYVRKFLVDVLLLRTELDIIVINNDTDLESLGIGYISEIQKAFAVRPERVLFRFSDGPRWVKKLPFFNTILALHREIDRAYNALPVACLPPRVHTYNLSFPASLYAKVGGFWCGAVIGEDLTFARDAARIFSKNIFQETHSRLVASCRRIAQAYIREIPLPYAWDSFTDDSMRFLPEEELRQRVAKKESQTDRQQFFRELALLFDYCLRYRISPYAPQRTTHSELLEDKKSALSLCVTLFRAALDKIGYSITVKKDSFGNYLLDFTEKKDRIY